MRKVEITNPFVSTGATSLLPLVRGVIGLITILCGRLRIQLKLNLVPRTGGRPRGAIAGRGGDVAGQPFRDR